MDTVERIRKIVAEQLDVDIAQMVDDARFIDDLGAVREYNTSTMVARMRRLQSAIRQPRVTCMGGFPQPVFVRRPSIAGPRFERTSGLAVPAPRQPWARQ
jgi:hypothetical protein